MGYDHVTTKFSRMHGKAHFVVPDGSMHVNERSAKNSLREGATAKNYLFIYFQTHS